MVAAVIVFPTLVTGGIEKTVQIDADKALEPMQTSPAQRPPAPAACPRRRGPGRLGANGGSEKEDPMKGLLESMKQDEGKKP